MKKCVLCCTLLAGLLCLWTSSVVAGSDKINPGDFICAEYLVIGSTEQEPPLFEALQIDGYVAAEENTPIADPDIMPMLMMQVYALCQTRPTEKLVTLWRAVRKEAPLPEDSLWRADKTKCRDYERNPDDGSGFLIWLDGYNRSQSKSSASVLNSDAALDAYLEACKRKPDALMLKVMREKAR